MESGPNIEPGYQSVMSRRLLLKNWLAKPTISTTKNEQRITKNDFTNHEKHRCLYPLSSLIASIFSCSFCADSMSFPAFFMSLSIRSLWYS